MSIFYSIVLFGYQKVTTQYVQRTGALNGVLNGAMKYLVKKPFSVKYHRLEHNLLDFNAPVRYNIVNIYTQVRWRCIEMNIGFLEDLKTEFKSDLKKLSDEAIIDSIVAFANTEGGEVLSWC